MRRMLVVASLIIVSFVLQTTILKIPFIGYKTPDLLLIITVSFALIRGKREGAYVGLACGILKDIFFGFAFGYYGLIYLYIGFIAGLASKLFYKDSLLVPTLVIITSNYLSCIAVFISTYVMRGKTNYSYYFYNIMIPEIFYTTIVMIFMYRFILYIDTQLEAKEKGV